MPSSSKNYLKIKVSQMAMLPTGTQKVTDSNLGGASTILTEVSRGFPLSL